MKFPKYPSIDRMVALLGVSREDAESILSTMEVTGSLDRIGEKLGTYGVEEFIPQGCNKKNPAIKYCNTRDPHKYTVMSVGGMFKIGRMADMISKGNYK